MLQVKTEDKILLTLLREFKENHSARSLSEKIGISRVGTRQALKKLEKEKMIILSPIGKGKTSVNIAKINWQHLTIERRLSLLLAEEALNQSKWRYNFKELENYVDFLVLFGSILHSPKEANDIDILSLVSNEKNFVKLNRVVTEIQTTQNKKIHSINLTIEELKNELKDKNKAYLDALKKGAVLFGQENFVKFIKEISK